MSDSMSDSTMALGCWQFAGAFGFWTNQQRSDSIKTIHAAIRGGVRHFDTAQGYGNGRSEQLLGQQLRRFRDIVPRQEFRIATKIMPMPPEKIEAAVRTSSRRLCTPYIDILHLHWPTSRTDILPMLRAMNGLKASGMVKEIGVSNFPLRLLKMACDEASIDRVQIPGSLLWIRDLDETVEFCKRNGIRTEIYSPQGMGLLSGAYRTIDDLKPEDSRRNLFCFDPLCRTAWNDLLEEMETGARRLGCTRSQLALAWALGRSADTVVFGARDKVQLQENLAAARIIIRPEIDARLTAAARRLEQCIPPEQDNPFGHRW